MTSRLTEIMRLAEDVAEPEAFPITYEMVLCDYQRATNPQTVKRMVELIRIQHEALSAMTEITCVCHPDKTQTIIACDIPHAAQEALAAYERFVKGE